MEAEIKYRKCEGAKDFLRIQQMPVEEYWSRTIRLLAMRALVMPPAQKPVYVAAVDDTVVGFAEGTVIPGGTLMIDFVYVIPECRGRGVARHLITLLEQTENCNCAVVVYNKALRGLYQGLGYGFEENLEVGVKDIRYAD